MANKLDKRMIGIKELLYIIKENHEKIFRSQNATFLSLTDNKNKSCLELLIPDKYWKTGNGGNIFLRLEEDQRELSNLVNGESGHTGIKATRKELSEELCGENYDIFLKGNREKFEQWFDRQIIVENFSIECLPQVCSFLEKRIDNIKKGNGSNYKKHGDFQYDIDVFQKTLQNLCAMGRYADFFWWLFMYAFFQSEITKFLPHVPKTQYSEMLSYLNNSSEKNRVFDDKQMVNVESKKFWDIRRKLVSTAYGHLIIAGPSLKDAFSVDDAHTIVQSLKESIEKGRLSEISVLLTDPIIFDSHVNCGDPIRDISGTVETLQERFYDLCERNKVKLHIYFLPLLQIDHAVITEEFMAFRSNKLWNRERKYKGAYGLYLANYYISHKVSDSEYLAHKEYLHTIMENSTTIYPAVDVDYSLLNKLSAKSKHMHWRLKSIDYKYIYLHKLYEKQLFSHVCNTWSADVELIGNLTGNKSIYHHSDLFKAEMLLNDESQKVLLPYLWETQKLFDEAIRKHDHCKESYCRIFPSLDLGFPNNIQRLAGGFATGMLVTWQCGIDIVPIDATVNVCTSSVFKLDSFKQEILKDGVTTQKFIEKCFDDATDKGYSFSFTSGNHFLIIAKDKETQEYYLVLHSSANELKKSYMGLYPVEGNWYANEIKIIEGKGGRYFRYLKDAEARHFIRMAQNFKNYNEEIHRWLAKKINNGKIISESNTIMKHHYYMPTENSIALGTFAEPVGTEVPIFSETGKNIYIFKIGEDNWQVNLGGNKGNVCIVPHGWGQKIEGIKNIKFEKKQLILELKQRSVPIEISSQHHIELAEKTVRRFNDGYEFLAIGKNMIQGTITKELVPCYEYSQNTIKKEKK